MWVKWATVGPKDPFSSQAPTAHKSHGEGSTTKALPACTPKRVEVGDTLTAWLRVKIEYVVQYSNVSDYKCGIKHRP